MKPVISIIGCGWMGLPCAKHLVQLGYLVKGTTTTSDKLATLQKQGIEAYLLDLDHAVIPVTLFDCDILFINFPPGRGAENVVQRYQQRIAKVIATAQQSGIKKIIFASSTGVYAGVESQLIVDENTPPDPQRDSAKAMLSAEKMLTEYTDQLTILRFSGLVGADRKAARFLAGKTDLPNPNNAVNLVHLEDCIAIVLQVIAQEIFGNIYNVAADKHPTRKDYYAQQAQQVGLLPPTFKTDQTSPNKIVSNEKIKRELGYSFIHSDPFLF